MKRKYLIVLMFLPLLAIGQTGPRLYNSYKGLVMAGYQGWFNTPFDGAGRSWHHYNGNEGFKPGSCTIDFWPDVSEYDIIYKTDFKLADGSAAYTFSSYDESTVMTHFRWMKEYGIDGVFMQRFVSEVKRDSGQKHFNKVFASAVKGANKYGRAICLMYDLSGMRKGDENFVIEDLKKMSIRFSFKDRKKNPSYLYHNGKPLVSIWGVGFNDKRAYGLNEVEKIVEFLETEGYSVMLGVPTHWRNLTVDTSHDKRLHQLIKRSDIIMPWFVGRYNESTYSNFKHLITEDVKWCKKYNVDYAPLSFPGFSWHNLYGKESNQIPRNKGLFLWKQMSWAISQGAEMLYIAMFDEIDEGTAIFKCTKNVPVGKSIFVPIEKEVGTDHYLWLVGQAGKMLRRELPLTETLPTRE